MDLKIVPMEEKFFDSMIELTDAVMGKNYYNLEGLATAYNQSLDKDLNCSFVLLDGSRAVGVRETCAANNWTNKDKYTPEKWKVPQDKVCYFSLNAIYPEYRGKGLGQQLLNSSIGIVKQQGALAGVADIWLNSPNNSAYKYFSKAGATVVNINHNRWKDFHNKDTLCDRCGAACECLGAEMILYFGENNE